MKGIAIYMEGGGSGSGKYALRRGMDALLKPLKTIAQCKGVHWKLVACGGRDATFRMFRNATNSDDTIVVLLVDSEGPVPASTSPIEHLKQRDPSWKLQHMDGDAVHLMVQVMETWIVADVGALSKFYGRGFEPNRLPRRQILEEEPKDDLARALARATVATSRGSYHKINHASELLGEIDPETLKRRCPHFERLWEWLKQQLC